MSDPADGVSRTNGRRVALAIVAVAFLASLTTLLLALGASRRANERDAAGMAADSAELHSLVSRWMTQRDAVIAVPATDRDEALKALGARAAPLATWAPRTPCGAQARDQLVASLRADNVRLQRGDAPHDDPSAMLDASLKACEANRGRDVNI
ncbi:hypothetical protein [Luteibacter sahnii]|uniref:hypothetical protein n=1 Tax=Luteibacter sahnii TaxID=3021977 RepID=UPI002A6A9EB6|nr:hypothetical protein [Luteibacter sp. PPL193]MDY1547059.1 hypothetical protein [Luteibacter sp. PPL193]